MKITTYLLSQQDACDGQIQLFRETFGPESETGVETTEENLIRAWKADLDTRWLMVKLMPRVAKIAFRRMEEQAWERYAETRYCDDASQVGSMSTYHAYKEEQCRLLAKYLPGSVFYTYWEVNEHSKARVGHCRPTPKYPFDSEHPKDSYRPINQPSTE